jgi:hypothetical protein
MEELSISFPAVDLTGHPVPKNTGSHGHYGARGRQLPGATGHPVRLRSDLNDVIAFKEQ